MPSYVFGSKDGLYQAVMERAFAAPSELAAELGSHLGGKNPGEALALLVGAYIDFLAAQPTYVRLIQRASMEDSDRLGRIAAHEHAVGEGLSVLANLVDVNGFRSVDPRQLFISIAEAVNLNEAPIFGYY